MKTAVITGATSGLGLAFTGYLLSQGFAVVGIGRSEKKLTQLTHKFEGQPFTAIQGDLSVSQDVTRVAQELNQFSIDWLILNAGIQSYQSLESNQFLGTFHEEMQVNLAAPVELVHRLLPKMTTESRVILVSSLMAKYPKISSPGYCVSKSGLTMFARAIRPVPAKKGIHVQVVNPPLMATTMTKGRDVKERPEDFVADLIKQIDLNKPEIYLGKAKWIGGLEFMFKPIFERMFIVGRR